MSYLWGFGSFLGVLMVFQVFSGVLLSFYYVSGYLGWDSVVVISREVSGGYLLRLFHSNVASFIFVVLFVHFFRGLIQASFLLSGPWLSGWLLKLLIMASAFLGYVLPWGQMSFWGATVIINLLSVLPKGVLIVMWLWGGFYVSSFTCSFFFALHFLLPMMVMLVIMIHLFLLHVSGSSVYGGMPHSFILSMKFSYFFLYKDMINMILMGLMLLVMLLFPDWSVDPVNFSISDVTNSPIHIQPEWYFLHLYAILRSIPNKAGGLIGFFMALLVLVFLSFLSSKQSFNSSKMSTFYGWWFLMSNLLLLWLGMQPVETPYIFMGQMMAFSYFLYFIMLVNWSMVYSFNN